MAGRKWFYNSLLNANDNKRFAGRITRLAHQDANESGHYTEDRTKLHDRIIKKTLGPGKTQEKPFALVIAGGPTSGKSTLITALRKKGILPKDKEGGVITINKNPFTNIPEFHTHEDARHPEKVIPLVDEYYDLMIYMLQAAIEKKMPIILEEHCDDLPFTRDVGKMLKDAGYETAIIGMATTPEAYFEHENRRCSQKHLKSDHPWALSCHRQLARNWKEYTNFFDVSILARRNTSGPPLSIIATAKKSVGEEKATQQIFDKEFYDGSFKKWQTANTESRTVSGVFGEPEAGTDQPDAAGMGRSRSGSSGGRGKAAKAQTIAAADGGFVERLATFASELGAEGQKR